MTLNKPNGRSCSNCYYCTSFIGERIIPGGCFKNNKIIDEEKFMCNRYPPFPILKVLRNYDSETFTVTTKKLPLVNKDDWCGEWSERYDQS